jgi:hypothetical protein
MNFEDFSLSKETMKSISEIGFEEPTPIQVSAIPLILNNCDIVEPAQERLLPLVSRLLKDVRRGENPLLL